jgi:GTP cyclohydrolase I
MKDESIIKEFITGILVHIGEDPSRDGLKDTPSRVVKSYKELFSGYNRDPSEIFTTFENDGYKSMVVLRNIEMYSFCEHHMLPFFGKAHIAYIPNNGKIVGISKLARLIDIFSKRLQVQERIGEQVTDTLMKHLQPKGAACVIEAKHMCMCMRGVAKQNSEMITSSVKGEFLDDPAVRQEFMDLIYKGK